MNIFLFIVTLVAAFTISTVTPGLLNFIYNEKWKFNFRLLAHRVCDSCSCDYIDRIVNCQKVPSEIPSSVFIKKVKKWASSVIFKTNCSSPYIRNISASIAVKCPNEITKKVTIYKSAFCSTTFVTSFIRGVVYRSPTQP